jgi:hypothetical protein
MTPEFTHSDLSIDPEIQTVSELRGRRYQLTPIPSTRSELFRTPLQAKSLPCHSYEYMGGGGYPPRVHISLNLQHLAFSPHRALNPYAPSHTRHRHPKSLCAFTYENTGGRGSSSSHFLFSIFAPNPSLHPSAKLLPRPRRERRELPSRNRRADLPHQVQIKVKIVVRVQNRAQDFVGHE